MLELTQNITVNHCNLHPALRSLIRHIVIIEADFENTSVGARYFESLTVDGIVYPPPFAPVSEIIAAGWQPRPFKDSHIPEGERAQLEQWAKSNRVP